METNVYCATRHDSLLEAQHMMELEGSRTIIWTILGGVRPAATIFVLRALQRQEGRSERWGVDGKSI